MNNISEKSGHEELKGWVLVLRDSDGALFTITSEILRSALVKEAAHEAEIRKWISAKSGPDSIEKAFPDFTVIGAYLRELDPRIIRTYAAPKIIAVLGNNDANP